MENKDKAGPEATKAMTTGDQQPTKAKRVNEDADVPSGFDTRVGRERGDGWLIKTPGQVVQGRLLGRYEMRGQNNDDGTVRVFYQIRLDGGHPVKAQYNNPDNKEEKIEVMLTDGQILNVDEHKALEDLITYATDGGVYNAWWKYLSEDPIKGRKNKTFWRVKGPRLQCVKAPMVRPITQVAGIRRGEDENDIPFGE